MLTFDESKHEYRVDGVVLPSVTQILTALGMYKGADFFNPESLELGRYIHQACEFYDKGTLDESQLDPVLGGYLEAWKKFRADTGYTPIFTERIMYSSVHGFAGKPDSVGMMSAAFALPDIKHGGYQPCYELQTAGYAVLIMESEYAEAVVKSKKSIKRLSVYLEPDGRYVIDEHKKITDVPEFMACLTTYNIRRRYGLNGK